MFKNIYFYKNLSMEKKEIIADKNLVAFCGLYCGACDSYLKGRCPGCRENTKATWCKIRTCCMENGYSTCADCTKTELKDCKKFHNLISKVMGLVFNSDRSACIGNIKEKGLEVFAQEMCAGKKQSIPRKPKK
jgi:hypothetical protein